MSSEAWSQRTLKSKPDAADEVALIDSTDLLNSKRTSFLAINRIQSIPNVVVVYEESLLPDAVVGFISTISDAGGLSQVNFTYNSPSTFPYLNGQTVELSSIIGPASYNGFFLMQNVTANSFTLETLAGGAVPFVPGVTGGFTVRALAKDTGYLIESVIGSGQGYRFVDDTLLAMQTIGSTKDKLFVTGTGTFFLSGKNPKFLDIDIEVKGNNAANVFNIKGSHDYLNQIIRLHNTDFNDFGSLGTIEGVSLDLAHTKFSQYTAGITLNDVMLKGDDIEFDPAGAGVFMTINNLRKNPVPLTVNLSNLKPSLSVNAHAFSINPATPPENTCLITDSSKITGNGKIFTDDTFTTKAVDDIISQVSLSITNFTASGTSTQFTKVTIATGSVLANGQQISIVDSQFYDGTFTISNFVVGDSFDINIPFSHVRIGAHLDRVGDVPTKLSIPFHGVSTGETVIIHGSVHYDGSFIATVIGPSEISIPIPFVQNDANFLNSITMTTPRDISSFNFIAIVKDSILLYANNGFGGTTVTVSIGTLNIDYLNDRTVTIGGTSAYNGTFKIFNLDAVNKKFDIQRTFVTNEGAVGNIHIQLTSLNVLGHTLSTNTPVIVKNSIDYDAGGIVRSIDADNLTLDIPFDALAPAQTGILHNGSLDGTVSNVEVDNVGGLSNSLAIGTIRLNNGTGSTLMGTNDQYENFTLAPLANVKEGDDNELWRMTDPATGEMEYRGIKPIVGGEAFVSLIPSSGAQQSYKIRIIKNGLPIVNSPEFGSFLVTGAGATIGVSTTFPINAVQGDKFRIQPAKTTGSSTSITVSNFVFVVKDK